MVYLSDHWSTRCSLRVNCFGNNLLFSRVHRIFQIKMSFKCDSFLWLHFCPHCLVNRWIYPMKFERVLRFSMFCCGLVTIDFTYIIQACYIGTGAILCQPTNTGDWWWRHQMETFSALLAFSPVTSETHCVGQHLVNFTGLASIEE